MKGARKKEKKVKKGQEKRDIMKGGIDRMRELRKKTRVKLELRKKIGAEVKRKN